MDNSIPPTNFTSLKNVVLEKSVILEKNQYLDTILSDSWLNEYFKLYHTNDTDDNNSNSNNSNSNNSNN